MQKIGIIVLAGTEGRAALGRVVNAMETAKEFGDAGDDVRLIFDGAGTEWIGKLADEEHSYHDLFEGVRDSVEGACRYCADAYGVLDEVESAGINLLDEHDGHPSLRRLVVDGYQLITF